MEGRWEVAPGSKQIPKDKGGRRKKKGQGHKVVEGKDKRTKRKQRLGPRREERKLTGSE